MREPGGKYYTLEGNAELPRGNIVRCETAADETLMYAYAKERNLEVKRKTITQIAYETHYAAYKISRFGSDNNWYIRAVTA